MFEQLFIHTPYHLLDEALPRLAALGVAPEIYFNAAHLDRLAGGRERVRLNLGADLIVGFPAENETAFRETRELIEAVELSYLHLFPYSPRRGTVAASWPDRVPAECKKERREILAEIISKKKKAFINSNINCKLEVLLEKYVGPGKAPDDVCGWFGHSRNYLPVLIEAGPATGIRPDLVAAQAEVGKVVGGVAVRWDGRRIVARRRDCQGSPGDRR